MLQWLIVSLMFSRLAHLQKCNGKPHIQGVPWLTCPRDLSGASPSLGCEVGITMHCFHGSNMMSISGSSGASGTARVGVRQGRPLSPTLFGIFFDSLDAQLQAESAAAGVERRGARVPGPLYADDVALLSPSAQGLQHLLDTMQSFCVTNGLAISIPKTEVVVFGGGHQQCQWHVRGHGLKRSESFIHLGMLFHED